MAKRFHPLTVRAVTPESTDAVTIEFDVPESLRDDFRYKQGQYVAVRTHINNHELRRSYSICASVPENCLQIAIKSVPGGVFSSFANQNLKSGDTLDVFPPMGKFTTTLNADAAKTYALFAAGSGITPIISTLKTILAEEPKAQITLFYGNRRAKNIMFANALADLKNQHLGRLQVYHFLTGDVQDLPLFNGRLDGAKVTALLRTIQPAATIDEAFICGPGDMADVISATLQAHGLRADQIHIERFGTAQPRAAAEPKPAADAKHTLVTIIQDGDRQSFDMTETQTVLDAGLAAGLALPYSCRGGVCCTCRAKVLEGAVDMGLNYNLEDYELAQGYVLTCQARPTTPTITLEYSH